MGRRKLHKPRRVWRQPHAGSASNKKPTVWKKFIPRGKVAIRTTNQYQEPKKPQRLRKDKKRSARKATKQANKIRMRVIRSKKGR